MAGGLAQRRRGRNGRLELWRRRATRADLRPPTPSSWMLSPRGGVIRRWSICIEIEIEIEIDGARDSTWIVRIVDLRPPTSHGGPGPRAAERAVVLGQSAQRGQQLFTARFAGKSGFDEAPGSWPGLSSSRPSPHNQLIIRPDSGEGGC